MKRNQIVWILLTLLLVLAGCSAHNPFIATDTTDVNPLSKSKYAPHKNRIYVTSANLPATAKHEVLGQVEVGKVSYGSSEDVLQSLADSARDLGADAVVEIKTWHQPSGWSWAAPHGSGKVIKITEPGSLDFATLGGDWK